MLTGQLWDILTAEAHQKTKQDESINKIDALDLSMVKMKLCLPIEREGKDWGTEQADIAELWYKRFLKLMVICPNADVVPTKLIDEMWHAHILDTHAYVRDCNAIFGEYIHHFPYFGLRGEQDAQNLDRSFETSVALFEEFFGESPVHAMKAKGECCGRANGKASCDGGGTGGGGGCSRNETPSQCQGGGTGGGGGCSRNAK